MGCWWCKILQCIHTTVYSYYSDKHTITDDSGKRCSGAGNEWGQLRHPHSQADSPALQLLFLLIISKVHPVNAVNGSLGRCTLSMASLQVQRGVQR